MLWMIKVHTFLALEGTHYCDEYETTSIPHATWLRQCVSEYGNERLRLPLDGTMCQLDIL